MDCSHQTNLWIVCKQLASFPSVLQLSYSRLSRPSHDRYKSQSSRWMRGQLQLGVKGMPPPVVCTKGSNARSVIVSSEPIYAKVLHSNISPRAGLVCAI